MRKMRQTISGIYNPYVYRLKPLKITASSKAVTELMKNNWPLSIAAVSLRDDNITLRD